jgi:cytochrome c oxidase subunit 2
MWNIQHQTGKREKNELHVPTGRPILFQLRSTDVIHSFWIPNLQGKKDLVPGRPTSLWMQIGRPGIYRGQCAEFCGYQHAHMGLLIVAESPEQFAAWQQAQRTVPPAPATERQKRGQQLFLTGSCVLCHTIAGTLARSRVGPPLTHLASQQTIGAGVVANTRENLARWIRDPHTMKPGVRMPQNFLAQEDLAALLDYLATLK